MEQLRVKPIIDYKLCPSNMTLDSDKVYNAAHATNQPDWEKYGLIFVDGFLLERGEYEIIAPKVKK
jgi:hypothetical protein